MTAATCKRSAQLVHNERCERFALDVFRNDQQRTTHLGDLFQDRKEVFHRADFLLVNEDEGVLEGTLHTIRVGDEIRREIAAVELHTFDDIQAGLDCLSFLNRDNAVFSDFLHRVGNDVADRRIVVGGNGGNLRDHVALHRLGQFLELFGGNLNRALNTALHRHRIGTGGNGLHTFAENGLSQNGCSRGAITSNVAGL